MSSEKERITVKLFRIIQKKANIKNKKKKFLFTKESEDYLCWFFICLTVKQITKSAKQLKSAITIDATFLWIALCMSNKVHEKNKQQTLF